ncbi:MAG: hypothetical protein Q7O66_20155 [Dehalococcoidia bacterium]|nr:hypothetical protein [Dehalococcoidia bacterium]
MAEATCPNCGTTGLEVSIIDRALNKEGGYLRRRFDCNACDNRFSTYEMSISPNVASRLDLMARAKQLTWGELIEQE